LKPCPDQGALARQLHQNTVQREEREIARLGQVLEFCGRDGCQTSALCSHFGESRGEPCGHCSWCANGRVPAPIPLRVRPALDDQTLRRAVVLRRERGDVLREPEALARVLCGLSSPRLTKAKLHSHPLFGAAGHVSYPEVLARLTAK
jgi:ATP-dependent DNA helicase RecQ